MSEGNKMFQVMLSLLLGVHVLGAIFWTGAMLVNAGFVLPALLASGSSGTIVMNHIVTRYSLPRYITIAIHTTILSGLVLLWHQSQGFQWAWFSSTYGKAMTLGVVLALAAAAVSQLVNSPAARRIGLIGSAQAHCSGTQSHSVEDQLRVAMLQSRLTGGARISAGLLSLAAMLMSSARYYG